MSFQFFNLKTINSSQESDINLLKNRTPSEVNFGKGLISNNNQNIWEWGDYKVINVVVDGTSLLFNNIKISEYTFNLNKNQKYIFNYSNIGNNTFRFKDTPDGSTPSGTILSANDGINYFTNYATVDINFNGPNVIYPFFVGGLGFFGMGNSDSAHISFNNSKRYVNGFRFLRNFDNLAVDTPSSINLFLPNVAKNSDTINLSFISSGTVNLISNNFLINNVTGTLNISSNKEIYFYNNSWRV